MTPPTTKQLEEIKEVKMRMFPIMSGPAIPWVVIAPCEKQADRNHGQTLERLAERGGLCPSEAVAVLDSRKWCPMDMEVSLRRLEAIVKERFYLVEIARLEEMVREKDSAFRSVKQFSQMIHSNMPIAIIRQHLDQIESWSEYGLQQATAKPKADK